MSEGKKDLLLYSLVGLNLTAVSLAILAWADQFQWSVSLQAFIIFPLLGLLAFSLMWVHYIAAAVNRLLGKPLDLQSYYEWTGWIVLLLILLHPSILIFKLWRVGLGLPPESYASYVGSAGKVAVLAGSTSLIFFLLFESKRWIEHSRIWPVIVNLSDLAMLLIVYHALTLGGALKYTWFRPVLFFYTATLIVCIALRHYSAYRAKSTAH
jgi:hypothetical protein